MVYFRHVWRRCTVSMQDEGENMTIGTPIHVRVEPDSELARLLDEAEMRLLYWKRMVSAIDLKR